MGGPRNERVYEKGVLAKKRCSGCGKLLSIKMFWKSTCAYDGHLCRCRNCGRAENAEAHKKHREKHLLSMKNYRKRNYTKCRQNEDLYYQEHREECNARSSSYTTTEKGREVARRAGRTFRAIERHRVEKNKYNAKWYKTEAGKRLAKVVACRRQARGAEHLSTEIVKSIETANITRYEELTCDYCKTPISETGKAYHLEHKTPVSRGGSNLRRNLCISCMKCNGIKGTMTKAEFLRSDKFKRRLEECA